MSDVSYPKPDLPPYAPSCSIEIDDADIMKQCLSVESVTVDLSLDSFGYFSIVMVGPSGSIDNLAWIENELFRAGRKVAIKIGHAEGLRTMIVGEISDVKVDFPPSGSPSIEIIGDDSIGSSLLKQRRKPAIPMRYGNELISYTSEMDCESQNCETIVNELNEGRTGSLSATKRERRMRSRFILDSIEKEMTTGVGECVGSPEIVPGRTLNIDGLGKRLSGLYRVIGAIHSMDRSKGYHTTIMVMNR
jgi:phage protein D